MSYRVELTPKARIELYRNASWWAEHRSTEQAAEWLEGFESALKLLCENPERWPLAQESGMVPVEIREMLFGIGRRKTHRAVFRIHGGRVIVHGVRHLAQDALTGDDFS